MRNALEGKPEPLSEIQTSAIDVEDIAKNYAGTEVAKQKLLAEEQRKTREKTSKEMKKQTNSLISQHRSSTTAIVTSNVQNLAMANHQ